MNFLKQNWFKLCLVLAVFSLSYVLYGAFIANQVGKKGVTSEDALRLAKQCREDGEKYLQEDKDTATRKKYESKNVNCFYVEPAFIFNEELRTCLYSGGYTCDLYNKYPDGPLVGQNAKAWTRHIYDVYTNKSLVSVSVENSAKLEDWENRMVDNFWKESGRLGF